MQAKARAADEAAATRTHGLPPSISEGGRQREQPSGNRRVARFSRNRDRRREGNFGSRPASGRDWPGLRLGLEPRNFDATSVATGNRLEPEAASAAEGTEGDPDQLRLERDRTGSKVSLSARTVHRSSRSIRRGRSVGRFELENADAQTPGPTRFRQTRIDAVRVGGNASPHRVFGTRPRGPGAETRSVAGAWARAGRGRPACAGTATGLTSRAAPVTAQPPPPPHPPFSYNPMYLLCSRPCRTSPPPRAPHARRSRPSRRSPASTAPTAGRPIASAPSSRRSPTPARSSTPPRR